MSGLPRYIEGSLLSLVATTMRLSDLLNPRYWCIPHRSFDASASFFNPYGHQLPIGPVLVVFSGEENAQEQKHHP
ncbi:hypothetical protein E4O93_22445 [Diaphorobacter sp. DS2]|nr:hypothetical protein E4O93_22445 [Diaphorobacter sp. DS2]